MYDLYGKKAGEIIQLGLDDNYLDSEIYADCLSYDLVPYIQYADLTRSYFATLVNINDANLALFAETVARAVINEPEPITIYNLNGYDKNSVICAVERRMLRLKQRPVFSDDGDTITVSKVNGWNELVKEIESIPDIDELPPGQSYTTVRMPPDTKDKTYTPGQIKALIYRIGKSRGFNVAVYGKNNSFRVVFCKGVITKKTRTAKNHTEPASARFRKTVALIAWDTPYPFVDMSESNLKALVSAHPLRCIKVKGKVVTKHSLMVGKHNGKVAVIFKGEPVLTLDATHITRLTARQQVQIEDALAAYKDKVCN